MEELNGGVRQVFKGNRQPADSSTPLINLSEMDFDTYSTCVLEKNKNILFNSIMKTFGSIEVDHKVNLPAKYEIK